MKRTALFRITALSLLALCCMSFFRFDTTQKSMIRAIVLERPESEKWNVCLLYQAPDASADSAESNGRVDGVSAEGETLLSALLAAEHALPQRADYRLCDHVLLAGAGHEGDSAVLAEYEKLVLVRPMGRTAAYIAAGGFSGETLMQLAEQDEGGQLFYDLLQTLKGMKGISARLYMRRTQNVLVLPAVELNGTSVCLSPGGYLLADAETAAAEPLTQDRLQAAWLLCGKPGVRTFRAEGEEVRIRRCTVSVEPPSKKKAAFTLRLDVQPDFGTGSLTDTQRESLAVLCRETVEWFWQKGEDILRLGAYTALREGEGARVAPQKNSCPEIRTEVYCDGFF